MELTLCPGCLESFTPAIQTAVTPYGIAQTEHFTDPIGRLFCCEDCFIANG